MRPILTGLNYINYRFTSGYAQIRQQTASADITPSMYATRVGHACFEETFKGQSVRFPIVDVDGWMGFRIHPHDIGFRLISPASPGAPLLSGLSGKDDGLFEMRDFVWEGTMVSADTENMKAPQYPGVHAELRDDRVVYGRNYIPATAELRLDLDVESEVTVYSFLMGVDEDRALLRSPSEITLGNIVRSPVRFRIPHS